MLYGEGSAAANERVRILLVEPVLAILGPMRAIRAKKPRTKQFFSINLRRLGRASDIIRRCEPDGRRHRTDGAKIGFGSVFFDFYRVSEPQASAPPFDDAAASRFSPLADLQVLMSQSRLRRAFTHAGVCISIAALSGCSDERQQRPPPEPTPVRVTEAAVEDFPVRLKSLGTVTPLNSVVVRSRIDGELMSVLFDEGQTVKQGQLLAQIDPRPREADLAEALGRQQEAKVQLQNAEEELARQNDLLTKNYVSKQAVTNQEALVRQFRARLESADAAVASAKLQVDFTRIVAPISGRVGLRRVDRGNLIRGGDADGLVTITQVQPISAVFTIPETEVTAVLDAYRADKNLPVEAWDRDEQQRLALGTLAGLDNQIDTATGTLRLKANFANDDGRLFPNQFVNVRLHVRTIKDAIVIPGAAVQYGAQATYVFAIVDGNAQMREVTLGRADADKLVVTKGLNGGEIIVLEGLERLRDGRPVEIVDPNADPNAPATAKPARPDRGPPGQNGGPRGERRGPGPT